MNQQTSRRIQGELKNIEKCKNDLNGRGIHFCLDESNTKNMKVLIIPKHKSSGGLESPYTHGMFVFQIRLPDTYPNDPPCITFHPQNSLYRIHPNYYQCGKVCLSVLNTWGSDWTPMSNIITLMYTLEERFYERALHCEPGCESTSNEALNAYNDAVKYSVYQNAIADIVMRIPSEYSEFRQVISEHIQNNKVSILENLPCTKEQMNGRKCGCVHYGGTIDYPTQSVVDKIKETITKC